MEHYASNNNTKAINKKTAPLRVSEPLYPPCLAEGQSASDKFVFAPKAQAEAFKSYIRAKTIEMLDNKE